MSQFIFHIGRSKCGSSALQSALTTCQSIDGHKRLIYATLSDKGIIMGDALHPGLRGYQVSAEAQAIAELPPATLRAYADELRGAGADHIVLSNEGWQSASGLFRDRIFPEMGLSRPTVVFYVRPQAQFINAAWWQWGAWSDRPLQTWYKNILRQTIWTETIRSWAEFADVNVRLLPTDIFTDFLGLFGYSPPGDWQSKVVNKGLPSAVLRLYQARRDLRPSPHASLIDSVLSRAVNMPGAPWVLTPQMIENITAYTADDNEQLLGMLDADSAAAMRADPRWWDAAAFSDKPVAPADGVRLSRDELETLAAQLAQALMRNERALARLTAHYN